MSKIDERFGLPKELAEGCVLYIPGNVRTVNSFNPAGMIAQYEFQGSANDSLGLNNGTVNGAVLTSDSQGNPESAYSFPNSTSDIYLGNGALLNSGSITVRTKIRIDSLASTSFIFVRGGLSVDWGMFAYVNATDGFYFSTSTGTDNPLFTNVIPNIGQWYELACVFDAANGLMKVYLDMELIGTRSCGGTLRTNGTIGWTIGNSNSPSGSPLSGAMEYFEIINTVAITGSQIAYDASGNGNHGTLVNSPTTTRGGLYGYKGLKFNGSNQGMTLGQKMLFSSSYSMGWNVNLASLPASGGFQFLSSRVGVSFQTGFYVAFYNNGGTMEFSVVHLDLAGNTDLRFAYPFVAGINYRIHITWDGSNVRFYVNGVLIGTQAMTRPAVTTTNEYWFGIYGNDMTLPLNGKISNLYVNTSALDKDKIRLDAETFFIP